MGNKLVIPLSIILAGGLIAGAIFMSGKSSNQIGTPDNTGTKEITIRPIDPSVDRILGNPNAEIFIVEYSDTECSWCKVFHGTMKQVMSEYTNDGKVAWVFRHFPIRSAQSRTEAEATECAGELAGNDGFWKYIDRLFELKPENGKIDISELPKIAEQIGLDVTAFNTCLESGRQQAKVQSDYDDAIAAGAKGTPYNVIVSKDGQKAAIPGAQPLETMKSVIDSVLQ